MKWKSVATNETPWEGVDFSNEKVLVVPDQSLSIEEILERFTLGQSLEIGRDGNYDDEGHDDLEKLQFVDLVDKEEYIDKLRQTQKNYEKQEKKRAAEEKKRIEDEEREKMRIKILEEKAGEKPAAK